MARQRLIIIAPTMQHAKSLAYERKLGSHEWIYIYKPESLLGYRHQEPEQLFDPEHDVLVHPQMEHTGDRWEELKIIMNSTGLIYRMADT